MTEDNFIVFLDARGWWVDGAITRAGAWRSRNVLEVTNLGPYQREGEAQAAVEALRAVVRTAYPPEVKQQPAPLPAPTTRRRRCRKCGHEVIDAAGLPQCKDCGEFWYPRQRRKEQP